MSVLSFLKTVKDRRTKLCFSSPHATQVVNLDGRTTGSCLEEMLLSGIPFESLDFRFGQTSVFYCSPRVVLQTIRCLLRLLVDCNTHSISIKGMLRVAYYVACLKIIRPRVVLDFVHNSDVIHFARYYPAAQYLCIQNGYCCDPLDHSMDGGHIMRGQFQYLLAPMKPSNAKNVHIFCFGEKDVELFSQLGLGENQTGIQYHACGPLKADFYLHEELHGALPAADFDICYCSQVAADYIESTSDFCQALMKSNDLITDYLRRYNEIRGLKIAVAMRTWGAGICEDAETEYFRSRFGQTNGFYLSPKKDAYSSYRLLARSHVVLGLNSTTGFDAIGWGKKALFAPFHLQDIYRMSSQRYKSDADMWKWLVAGFTYEEFETKLDELLAIPHEQYIADIHARAQALSSYGRKLPAHKYIRQMILEACEQPPDVG